MYFNIYEANEASSYLDDHGFKNDLLILQSINKVPELRETRYPVIDLANYIKDKEENGIQITISCHEINGEYGFVWEERELMTGRLLFSIAIP